MYTLHTREVVVNSVSYVVIGCSDGWRVDKSWENMCGSSGSLAVFERN